MGFLDQKLDIKIKELSNPYEIVRNLHIGTKIPILKEHFNYIINDLVYFQSKSLLLIENDEPIGHVLVYHAREEILYFGFYGLTIDREDYILLLVDEIIRYALKYKFKVIRGPINIPTIIYGWGFMKEGTKSDIFIGKPVNPLIYPKIFIKRGFYIHHEEKTYEGETIQFNPYENRRYDFSDYEIFTPKDWEELMEFKDIFLSLNNENLPATSKITPHIDNVFENYVSFVLEYTGPYMILFIRHIPTGEIIACCGCVPNPFRKNRYGILDSFFANSIVIRPDHRKKGLSLLIAGTFSKILREHGLKNALTSVVSNNINSISLFKKLGYKSTRLHCLLEMKL
ncbi:MAG: GNAT family N-acetyltransferase [Promethearchaeota archaeon]